LGEAEVPVFISYRPDPDNLKEFLDSGSETGVETKLTALVEAKLRRWAMSKQEGPQTHDELLGAGNEGVAVLAKAILGDTLKKIPSSVPTPVLFKFFDKPQPDPTECEAKIWGPHWEKVEKTILAENGANGLKQMETAVKDRRDEINKLQRTDAEYKIKQFGILLLGLNMGEISLLGQLKEVAEKAAKESREREAEKVELQHAEDAINKLAGRAKDHKRTSDRTVSDRTRGTGW